MRHANEKHKNRLMNSKWKSVSSLSRASRKRACVWDFSVSSKFVLCFREISFRIDPSINCMWPVDRSGFEAQLISATKLDSRGDDFVRQSCHPRAKNFSLSRQSPPSTLPRSAPKSVLQGVPRLLSQLSEALISVYVDGMKYHFNHLIPTLGDFV